MIKMSTINLIIHMIKAVFNTFDPNTGVPTRAEITPIRPDSVSTDGGSVTISLFCAPF
jgi:hypothetical protein